MCTGGGRIDHAVVWNAQGSGQAWPQVWLSLAEGKFIESLANNSATQISLLLG